MPVLSDDNEVEQVTAATEVLDIIQIPAFLCRQTDLLLAAAGTGKPVNVKKGQFLRRGICNTWRRSSRALAISVCSSQNAAPPLAITTWWRICVLAIMRTFGYPVVFDATHSVQLPGGAGRRQVDSDNLCRSDARRSRVGGGCAVYGSPS